MKITQKHYAHLRPQTLRDEVNTISRLLAKEKGREEKEPSVGPDQ